MNPNLLLGTISFLAWSVFSTWYYVTQIKDLNRRPDFVEGAEVPYEGDIEPEAMEAEIAIAEEDENPPLNDKPTGEVVLEPLPVVDISKRLTFYKNSTRLISPAELELFADSIRETLSSRKLEVEIVGHTCDLGTEKHNYELGLRRAHFVAGKLKSELSDHSIRSEGELSPLVTNTSENNRTKNRRVTIKINSL